MSQRCMGCMEQFGEEYQICPYCGYAVGTQAEEAIHIQPGTLLHDRYIVGKVLGFGGFGVTYLGWDGKLEQKVAIKEYLPSEFSTRMPGQSQVTVFNGERSEQFHDGLKKFVEEAKHLAKFQNEPGIVKIFDSFEENDTAYIVMEFLDGETLTSYLDRVGTIPEDVAVQMLTPLMESLQAVHAEGLLHRDIAPDNIFLTKTGEIKLIDFGASRYATTSHSRSLTVIIKPGYSPEEQYRSRGDQGPWTDVYALASTLYKMITGKTPPDAMERRAKYENQNKDILIPPHKLNKNLSVNREVAILNAMNVRIEDRTPDVAAFLQELNANPPAKRIYGKIKKLNLYAMPLWLKIGAPVLLACILSFAALMLTGVIDFSKFSEEIIIPEGIVVVPDVESLYTNEAIKQAEAAHLLAVTGGTVESAYIPAGKIILQTPIGGTYIHKNGTVYLTVSSGGKIQEAVDGIATVPYVTWASREEAVNALKQAGLGEPILEEAYDDNVQFDHVVSQSIEAGTQVKENTVVTLVISLGTKAFPMPDVSGMKIEEAEELLTSRGLIVSFEFEKNNDAPENTVLRQDVTEGAEVKRGDSVKLVICSGKATITLPDVVGQTSDSASAALKELGFQVTVLENYDNKVPEGSVISQSPEAGSAQLPGSMITIYVSKGKQPITLNFNANGGSLSESSRTVYFGNAYGELPDASRSGYHFAGWFTSAEGGTEVTSASTVSATASHTLYAHWTAAQYTVSFDGNGGSAGSSGKTVTFAGAYGDLPSAERKGYSFAGWYTSASGGSRITASSTVSTDSNHTLYAHWEAKSYTLTLNPNGGSLGESSRSVRYGSGYGSLPTPTRAYYDFAGWFTGESDGSQVSADTTMGASDVTIYAHWTQKAVTDWVPASEVPADAQIIEEKWTYSQHETMESGNASESGWTQTGSYWSETGSNSRKYATFPGGFDHGHWIYNNYASGPVEAYENETSKRTVTNEWSNYVYWHWMYNVNNARGVSNRAIYHKYGKGPDNGFLYKYFGAFENTRGDYQNDLYYCNSQSIRNYIIPERTAYSDCQGATRWFRFDAYVSRYTDYTKTFQYERTVDGLESSTEIQNGGNISNVQKYVRYRPV